MLITPERFKEEVLRWAEKIGVNPREIHIRHMKKKWASCSTGGRLTFATELLQESRKKRHQIIVHELLHLRYPNHGRMFNVLLNTYLKKNNMFQKQFSRKTR